jgi:hypothetical protein
VVGGRIAVLMRQPRTNLAGKDALPQLLATLARATTILTPYSDLTLTVPSDTPL